MTRRGIDQEAVSLFVVAVAGIGRRRRFDRRIGGAPAAGYGLLGIINVGLRDISATVAPLAAKNDHLARRVVINQDVRVPGAGRAVGTDLRPGIGARIVFPRVGSGASVHTGEAAIKEHAIDVRHIDHRAFLAVAGIGRCSAGLSPLAGAGGAAVGKGIEVVTERALARAGGDVHAAARGVPGDLVVGMPMIGPRGAIAGTSRGLRVADPQLRIGAVGGIETEYGIGVDTGAAAGIVLRHQQRAVLVVINGIGPIGVRG